MEYLGIFYGLALVIIIIAIVIIWRVLIKKEQFTAHYKESKAYNKPVDELTELVDNALDDINAKKIMHNSDDRFFIAKLGSSIWSWSETIEIKLKSSEQNTIVSFSSQCSLPTQVVDWGKNHRNSKRFFKSLEKELLPTY